MRLDGLRYSATHVDAPVLDHACHGFHRAHKHRSAKRTLYITQIVAFLAASVGLVAAFVYAPDITFTVLRLAAFVLFSAAIVLRLFAAAGLKQPLSRLASPARFPTYTILCPLYREANVVADLVAALDRIDYPGFPYLKHLVLRACLLRNLHRRQISQASMEPRSTIAASNVTPKYSNENARYTDAYRIVLVV